MPVQPEQAGLSLRFAGSCFLSEVTLGIWRRPLAPTAAVCGHSRPSWIYPKENCPAGLAGLSRRGFWLFAVSLWGSERNSAPPGLCVSPCCRRLLTLLPEPPLPRAITRRAMATATGGTAVAMAAPAATTAGEPPQPQPHAPEPGPGGTKGGREDSRAGRLSFCTKVCYGIGGVPNQIASSATAFYLQLFLLDIAQIPAAQVSLVLFGGKVSGAAADPVAGFFINRSRRTGSGRLMPWVLGCTPFIALAYFFLWFLPPFTSLRGLWYMTCYCLFQALATFFQVPYTALTMLLTPCPRERDSATAYRMTVEMAGTLMGATVHGLIVSGAHRPHRCEAAATPGPVTVSPNSAHLYCIAAAVVAATYPVCSSLLCLGVKERPDPSAPASGPGLSFLAGLGLTTRHPPYLKLVFSFLFISAAVQVEQSYLVLFCTHASQLHDHVQGLVLTVLVSAVLSTPLWEWVLQHFGKTTSAFGIFVMVPFAILLAAVPAAPVAYVVAFVSGVSIAVSLLLPWSMLPDMVDDFQLQHRYGPGLETIFYSSYVFFTKLSGACALGISTLSLQFSGYKAGACKQAEEVVVTLKVLIGAVPTCMILAGLCILMVGSTPKTPSQDASRRLSLRRRTSYSLA
ncbi:major facilitator superfamily domain-containing protein 2B isoform X2 [Sapajus apella]|uniref:Sphingosine-1-phosphate transporter MFSD2B n=1 Tax=Sapajus apella TaxID=9515 RepID=A0A6J3J6V4_SAPAP|nr:major facilitator superfamily domain-containing protein 2B isoform X2 [Sapajus apella]